MVSSLRLVSPAVLVALLATACVSRTPSDLRGYVDLTLDASDGTRVTLSEDRSPNKFRAQVTDDGDRCEFWAEADLSGDRNLRINTFPNQIADLIAGSPQTLDATTNSAYTIILNGATVYYDTPEGSWYSRRGTVQIAALPAPVERLQIQLLDVEMHHTDSDATGLLNGTLETTYIGAVVIGDDGRACPHLEENPPGLIY